MSTTGHIDSNELLRDENQRLRAALRTAAYWLARAENRDPAARRIAQYAARIVNPTSEGETHLALFDQDEGEVPLSHEDIAENREWLADAEAELRCQAG